MFLCGTWNIKRGKKGTKTNNEQKRVLRKFVFQISQGFLCSGPYKFTTFKTKLKNKLKK